MKINVECGGCIRGQASEWDGKKWVVKDCLTCHGTGMVEIEVIDKRQKTKNQEMVVPDKY